MSYKEYPPHPQTGEREGAISPWTGAPTFAVIVTADCKNCGDLLERRLSWLKMEGSTPPTGPEDPRLFPAQGRPSWVHARTGANECERPPRAEPEDGSVEQSDPQTVFDIVMAHWHGIPAADLVPAHAPEDPS